MTTHSTLLSLSPDPKTISQYDAKMAVAKEVAQKAQPGQVIGAGSGSTALLALLELARRDVEEGLGLTFIPTSYEIDWACRQAGVKVTSLNHAQPKWYFDGADEVDGAGNLIKGRGGAMYREKLVMSACESRYILVDSTKFVDKLGEKFAVPVECDPQALLMIERALRDLGADEMGVRLAKGKDGPVVTEKGNVILDVMFGQIGADLEMQISAIPGVLESGLFWGYNPQIMQA